MSLEPPDGVLLEVRGSLRTGGRIGTAQWQQDGLTLDMHDLVFRLEPALLMQGQLPLQQVQLGRLAGHPQQASQTAPPMTTLVWPMKVALQWQIDRVHWDATVPIEASGLQGSYHFDGQAHQWLLKRLQWAQGEYQGELTLQARAPMALQAQVRSENRPEWRPERLARLQAVLPLPQGASGLCVFSEDPGILRHLQDPRAPLEQEWLATVRGTVPPDTLEKMQFPGFRVSLNHQTDAQAVLRIAGKAAQGAGFAQWLAEQLPLQELRRQRIGRLGLAPLAAGEWRPLEPGERF